MLDNVMSVDIKYLKSQGLSAGAYKKLFTAAPRDQPKRVQELINLISQRARDAKFRNFRTWRQYAAIDYAYETPFQQTTATFVNHLLSQNLTDAEMVNSVKQWGLPNSLITTTKNSAGETVETFDVPTFFQIFVPLCLAYTTIRLAKLYNERAGENFLKYTPLKDTTLNRILCEITTDMARTQSAWFGYQATLKQLIRQTLKYGFCVAFPEEEWYHEEQVRFDENDEPKKETVKEGIRHILPHPTRMYVDPNRPASRINSDTGCEFGGCWFIRRYGDILDNRKYWNREKIFVGTNWLDATVSGQYFTEFFPCGPMSLADAWPAAWRNKMTMTRENAACFYNSGGRDQPIFLTEHFQKIVPGDWGLGEYEDKNLKKLKYKPYKHPVWHRFSLAGDDTVVYAEPCAYNPMFFTGYDYDDNAAVHSSLGLEIIPWQDQLGNLLSNMVKVAKQNLLNVTFYDEQIINKSDIENFKNMGERKYAGPAFLGFDSTNHQRVGLNVNAAFIPTQFAKVPITELLQLVPVMLNIMERVLQISAQEAGSAASHQQSKEEVVQTAGTSQNRVIFTGSGIDEGIDAWKKQIVDGNLAYADPEIVAQVSRDIDNLQQHLQEIGFKITGFGKKVVVARGAIKAIKPIRLEGFAATDAGLQPGHEKEMAQIIFQVVGTIAGQPGLFQAVGAQPLLDLLTEAAKLAGAPADFQLNPGPNASGNALAPAVLQAIQQAQQATMQAIDEKVAKPAAEAVAKDQDEIAQMQKTIEELKGIAKAVQLQVDKVALDKQKIAIKTEETQAKIQRDNAVAAADIARENKKAEAEIHIKQGKAAADVAISGAKAAHGAHMERTAAETAAAAKPAENKA